MKKNKSKIKNRRETDLNFLQGLKIKFNLGYTVLCDNDPFQKIEGSVIDYLWDNEKKEESEIIVGEIVAYRFDIKDYSFELFESIENDLYIIAQYGLEQGETLDLLEHKEVFGLLIVSNLQVTEDYQNKGVGKLLMAHLIENFKKDNDMVLTYPCPLSCSGNKKEVVKEFKKLYSFYGNMGFSEMLQYDDDGEVIEAKENIVYALDKNSQLIVGDIVECFQQIPFNVTSKKEN